MGQRKRINGRAVMLGAAALCRLRGTKPFRGAVLNAVIQTEGLRANDCNCNRSQ